MQEAWVQSWGWEDPLEKGKATHSSILTWRIPWGAKSWTQLIEFHLRVFLIVVRKYKFKQRGSIYVRMFLINMLEIFLEICDSFFFKLADKLCSLEILKNFKKKLGML